MVLWSASGAGRSRAALLGGIFLVSGGAGRGALGGQPAPSKGWQGSRARLLPASRQWEQVFAAKLTFSAAVFAAAGGTRP